jgi:hypothetical protein
MYVDTSKLKLHSGTDLTVKFLLAIISLMQSWSIVDT